MVYVSLLVISLLLITGLGLYSWRNRSAPGVASFSIMMFFGAFWMLTITLMLTSTSHNQALLWYRASFISIASLPVAQLVFVARYLQSPLITPLRLTLMSVIPLLTQVSVWTDERLHTFFVSVSIVEHDGLMVLQSWTPSYWFFIHTIYSAIILFFGLTWLFGHAISQFRIFRGQSVAFIVGTLILAIPNFAFAIGLIPPDIIILPFCMILTCTFYFWAIFHQKLLNLVPVARSKMVDIMQDGMIVLDTGNRIVDINPTAQKALSVSGDVIGQSALLLFEPWPMIVERFLNSQETQTEIAISSSGEDLYYEVRITSLVDNNQKAAGRLLLFRNITQRKKIEHKQALLLESLNEKNVELEKLYSMALDANPMTGLPGNNSIAAAITRTIQGHTQEGVIYTDLDNFKAFNDKYGFALGDEVIKFTAEIVGGAVVTADASTAFVGHIGGDDFVLLVPSGKISEIADIVIAEFDEGIREFYSDEDLQQGYISSVNRKGEAEEFPIMSISLAGVDLSQGHYGEYVGVNDACAELKKRSKAKAGSTFSMDLRTRKM
ncbi:MAG: diguanylate cyclase [Halieaceae bacterium]|jgi:diguanylate cyclase (GGDEF)-like protein/PAS domain S-box-containing protein|nr:diguanylate cyclase [Halieaceae bacterium]